MAITVEDLPRDSNGIVQGAWRILHASTNFHGEIGSFTMRHGESTEPACGRPLQRAVAAYGPEIYMEPWGALPPGFYCGEMIAHPVPAGIAWRAQPCPWRGAPALPDTLPPPPPEEPTEAAAPAEAADSQSADVLAGLPRAELEQLASALGIEIDGRWGDKRLRRAIRDAQA